ncbi:Cocaine esterase [Mycobacteroides salmoniphilum]|uniref:Cocaine esterase n=1 Tax=Mycobacteroides salmoniphilum TaxID=404941 RepID=A0A4R8S4I1_9MYCO|nr:CocE/NonD family hydrolase [Mycobacteroides salmoniphilum]TDZ79934.1 Cocaine esterase [Mycobacteroides salmoniphilum]
MIAGSARRLGIFAAILGLILTACGHESPGLTSWPPADGHGPCAVATKTDVPATMRDGTILRADVYRPKLKDPVPVILMRTQYGKSSAQVKPSRFRTPDWFASHCYLVVVQDVRGQGASDGIFTEFGNDGNDGYDTVEWAAGLPGSTGKVGMYGSSYVGATQWLAATTTPPHLTTIVPSNTASDYYDGWTYEGGAFRLGFVLPWAIETIATTAAKNRGDDAAVEQLDAANKERDRWLNFLPYQDLPPMQPGNPHVAPWYFEWIRHATRDEYWKRWSIRDRYENVKVPVLHFEGWYDAFLRGGLENFAGMSTRGGSPEARRHQRIVIGPWDHLAWGRETSSPSPLLKSLGTGANSPVNELQLAWFDHFLKGTDNGVGADSPRVDYYLMGANRWKSAPSWPLPQTDWTVYQLSGSGAKHDGRLGNSTPPHDPPDTFLYDPANPVPSAGGHSCCAADSAPEGRYDQSIVEQRADVLTYTSEPLATDTEVTGPISVDLWAASSAPDTDFTAKLVVVQSDGAAVNLNNGVVRTSLAQSLSDLHPVAAGRPHRYRIDIWPVSYQFRVGERIRLEISSSDFPQYAPNPNTGAPFGQNSELRTATQTILHDAAHPSTLTLPVIPAGDPGTEQFPMPQRSTR